MNHSNRRGTVLARLETVRDHTKVLSEISRQVASIFASLVSVLLLLGVPLMELVSLLR
ncbi:hypothetical protein [Jiangella anatolica]|uniref:hypothetical protein n=1 Tax=Jiangella anatolica TaxID=2670374 RepID=UPI001313DA04|nr:hypothetical protein [Jiangella anatolica]